MTEPNYLETVGSFASLIAAGAAAFAAYHAWRSLTVWQEELIGKRKAELAEEVLSGFYEASDVIKSVRSPMSFPDHESKQREKDASESPELTRVLDGHYVPIARIAKHSEFFSDLLSRKYRMKAYFGSELEEPFEELSKILNEIQNAAAGMMRSAGRESSRMPNTDIWEKWEKTIWWTEDDDDIAKRIKEATNSIETACRPVLETRK